MVKEDQLVHLGKTQKKNIQSDIDANLVGTVMISKDDTPKNEKCGEKTQDVAFLVLYNKIQLDVTEGATHYHATYVRPKTKKKDKEKNDSN